MEPSRANMINALILIALGIWGYVNGMGLEGGPSKSTLIAPGIGVILLLLTPMWRKGNKVVAHIGVLLTFLLLVALAMPFSKAIGVDTSRTLRVGTMMLSCFIAMVVFIQSFIKARKERLAK
jgi:hypothetical protein